MSDTPNPAMTTVPGRQSSGPRLWSIDTVRGIAIVLMALDHARLTWAPQRIAWIQSLDHVTPAWLATFLAPHLCAPAFTLLSGVAAGMFAERRGLPATRRFLASRAVWLIVLEVTVVHTGFHTFDWRPVFALQVIWALGLSMAVLAILAGLPRSLLGVGALAAMVLEPLIPWSSGVGLATWLVPLHEQVYLIDQPPLQVAVTYELLPWAACMVLGWAMAPWFIDVDAVRRQRRLGIAAVVALIVFIQFRSTGFPINSSSWTLSERGLSLSVLGFFHVAKHPASPAFLLMTVGSVMFLLAASERGWGRIGGWFRMWGRVPLFFYLTHLFVLQVTAWVYWEMQFPGAESGWWMRGARHWPKGYEPFILTAWVGWLLLLALTWPLCRWFDEVKQASGRWWLRYL